MALTITIFICAIIGMLSAIIFCPTIKYKKLKIDTYWIPIVVSALLILIFNCIDLKTVGNGLVSDKEINPVKILVLFFSMTFISVLLDELGLFTYLANKATHLAKDNQYSIFTFLFIAISILTVFTSNDIIILTFTPFICSFCKRLKINPVPYLISEFIAANTLSMSLIIGNPTNVYLALSSNISFMEYLLHMGLIALGIDIIAFFILLFIFKKSLKEPIIKEEIDIKLENKPMVFIGVIHLLSATILMAISSYINLEMWLVSLVFSVSLLVCFSLYRLKHKELKYRNIFQKLPYQLCPFLIGMFILVLALDYQSVTMQISSSLHGDYWMYGFSSILAGNLMNNIPMSVLYSSILSSGNLQLVYAVIASSNLCAILTPLGSLAGIMWMGILNNNGVKFKYKDFLKYCFPTGITMVFIAFLIIFIMI